MMFCSAFDYFLSKAKLTQKNNGMPLVSEYILSYCIRCLYHLEEQYNFGLGGLSNE